MVSRRTCRDECVVRLSGEDGVHRRDGAADTRQRRNKALRARTGIRLELVYVFFRNLPDDRPQVFFRMGEQNQILAAPWRPDPFKLGKIRMLQRQVQRPQPVRPLGMTLGNLVLQEDRIFVEERSHGGKLVRGLPEVHGARGESADFQQRGSSRILPSRSGST